MSLQKLLQKITACKVKRFPYVRTISLWKVPFYKTIKGIQWLLWKSGKSWHDKFFNECTPDFNCCVGEFAPNATEKHREYHRQKRLEQQFVNRW